MGQHRPQSSDDLRIYSACELLDVAFQIGPDKVLAPDEAPCVAGGGKAVGKSAPQPEHIKAPRIVGERLLDSDRTHLDIGDPTREGFGGLLQEVERGRP